MRPDEIERALALLGFETAGMTRQFALPMVLHRVTGQPRASGAIESWLAASGLTQRIGSPILWLARRSSPGDAPPEQEEGE